MKRIFSLALATALASNLAFAQNFTETNTDKANAVIAAAVAAHGGDALLENLRTLSVEHETVNYSVDQSRATEPPWDKTLASGHDYINPDNAIFVTATQIRGGGFEASNATVIDGEKSYRVDYRTGTIAKIAEPDFDTNSGPFVRITPALLVRTLNERSANAHYLGETRVDDVVYDVVGFSMTVGPAISMYFHRKTHLLHRSERIFPGFGLVEYEFNDYETIDGVPFNRSFNLLVNGDPSMERVNISTQVNQPRDDSIAADPGLVAIPEIQADPLSRQEIADGVWLIGGNGTYAMFVDMGDYIFSAGGTAGIPERIESLREVVGDKPLRYSMMTHHHSDHVLGVTAYEAEGSTLLVAAAHEAVIRRAADDGEALEVTAVGDRMALETTDRRIEIIDIGPTAHTEHLLVAYLPNEGILFEADHFSVPRAGPIRPAVSSTRTFAEAVARLDLDIRGFVSAHSARIGTAEDLQEALDAKVFRKN